MVKRIRARIHGVSLVVKKKSIVERSCQWANLKVRMKDLMSKGRWKWWQWRRWTAMCERTWKWK